MDTLSFFEQLANATHHNQAIKHNVEALPTNVKNTFLLNDSNSLRKLLSQQEYFPDALTVFEAS